MKAQLTFAILLVGACFPARAHDVITTKVTWSREISRLVNRRCVSCHNPGGVAFSLLTYQDARPWAKAIKEETLERRMPPWGAVKGFGAFRGDQGLTQEDLELISDWVEGGAPEGDPSLLPKVPPAAAKPSTVAGREILVRRALVLKTAMTVRGVHPSTVPNGGSLQVVARRPDGTVEPLLWLYQYNPRFDQVYTYENPLRFPAGTRIECYPPEGGMVGLNALP